MKKPIEYLRENAILNNVVANGDEFSNNHNNDKYNWILESMDEYSKFSISEKENEITELKLKLNEATELLKRFHAPEYNHMKGIDFDITNYLKNYKIPTK